MMNIAVKMTSDNKEFNRIFGPVNCGSWGCKFSPDKKCRMLICLCCENDDGFENEDVDWFVGSCDFCEDEIFLKESTLRIPLEGGGWKGCFCSFQCIREAYLDGDTDKMPIRDAQIMILEQNLDDEPIDIIKASRADCDL